MDLPIESKAKLSKEEKITLYEKFLDDFTDKEGLMKSCNPDAIFNWFAWQLCRTK